MSTFKIVKAHTFLGERGTGTGSADGRVVLFDEAQRTYEKGRQVLRKKLEEDEADLILSSLALSEVASSGDWAGAPNRERILHGHLPHSLAALLPE